VWGAAEGNGWHSQGFASPPANGARVVVFVSSTTFTVMSMPAFLLTLFAKNEKDNLSKSERNSLTALVGELARHFKSETWAGRHFQAIAEGLEDRHRLHARREGTWPRP